jgi:hypothetical protein
MGNDNVRFVILSPLFLTSDGMLDYIIGRSKRLTKSIFGITIKDLWKAHRKKERKKEWWCKCDTTLLDSNLQLLLIYNLDRFNCFIAMLRKE